MPATTGFDDVLTRHRQQWQTFSGIYRFDMVNTVAAGASMPVPLMGAFEIRDHNIAAWRDYFDSARVAKMSRGEDVSALIP